MINRLLKSVLNQDTAPVVVCDIKDIVVYMNPSAIARYHKTLCMETNTELKVLCFQKFQVGRARS